MTGTVELPLWLVVLVLVLAAIAALDRVLAPSVRWFFRRRMERAVARLKRGGYLAFLVLQLVLAGARWLGRAARRLHDAIRDERFLVGVELQNRESTPSSPGGRGEGVGGGGGGVAVAAGGDGGGR